MSLRPELVPFAHQEEAVAKLRQKANIAFFDDMGVGKTVQSIMIDDIRRKIDWPWRKTLVITLNGLMVDKWRVDFERFTNLRVVTLDPKNRERSWKFFVESNADVLIIHWEALWVTRGWNLLGELVKRTWLHVIADEVHKICARKNAVSINLKKVPTAYKTGLTGTPTTGRPDLLWSILNWLYPKTYRSYWKFYDAYVDSITNWAGYKEVVGVKDAELLQAEIAPFTIRRTLRECRPNMPSRMPAMEIFVELDPLQRAAYEQMRKEQVAWVEAQQLAGESEASPIVAQTGMTKALRLLQFGSAYARVADDNTVLLSEPSTKLDAAMELIERLVDAGEQVVVFSTWKQMILLLNKRLNDSSITHVTIHGDISKDDRTEAQRSFQAGEKSVFTGTIRSGGTGIDLFAARWIVFLDRDWSPTEDNQAIGRLDRIGQTRSVQPVYIIANNTVEVTSKIPKTTRKWSWFQQLFGGSYEQSNRQSEAEGD